MDNKKSLKVSSHTNQRVRDKKTWHELQFMEIRAANGSSKFQLSFLHGKKTTTTAFESTSSYKFRKRCMTGGKKGLFKLNYHFRQL